MSSSSDSSINKELFAIGYSQLQNHQKDVIKDCMILKSGGLCLSMGSGKTFISIVLALMLSEDPILVVCSKTLISNWITEIEKFFKDKLKYVILHKEFRKDFDTFKLDKDVKLILTTAEVTSKAYTDLDIENEMVYYTLENEGRFGQHHVCHYRKTLAPYKNNMIGQGILYSMKWGTLIIDEAQNYTNITTTKCRSLISLSSSYKWCLSGTLFSEPKIERILGYYLLIDHPYFAHNLPEAQKMINSDYYRGIKDTMVTRKEKIVDIKVNEYTITNNLTKEEEKIYLSMKEILKVLNRKVKEYKDLGNVVLTRKFSAYILAMLTYLRQCTVCPMLHIANIYLDILNMKEREELSKIIMEEFMKLDLKEYLDDERNVLSSRMKNVLGVIEKINKKKVVIFTCYRTNLDLLSHFLINDLKKNVLTIEGNMNSTKRSKVLDDFNKSDECILLLTFNLGCEGLNLQSSDTVLLVDFDWNDTKSQQAIARIVRRGQLSKEVSVYYFLSNLAIEKAIFKRQVQKLNMLKQLDSGKMITEFTPIKVKDIINIITTDENQELFYDIRRNRY